MKYQFTTEGAPSMTRYHLVEIVSKDEEVLFRTWVSTPLSSDELEELLEKRLVANDYANTMSARIVDTSRSCGTGCIGLASMCGIIANIKPVKVNITFCLNGEKKSYSLDAEKLETLLKSLEAE